MPPVHDNKVAREDAQLALIHRGKIRYNTHMPAGVNGQGQAKPGV